MVVKNKEEIERAQLQLKEERAKRRRLKAELSETDKNIKRIEGYILYLGGKPKPDALSKKSIPDHVEDILRKNGKPMRIKDILSELRKINSSLEHTAEQTLAGALIRYVNKGERFRRDAPNTYGLK